MTPEDIALRAWRADGLTRFEELVALATLALGVNTVVEVGSLWGRSTIALALASGGLVYAVDTWAGSEDEPADAATNSPSSWERFVSNVADLMDQGHVIPVMADSLLAALDLRRSGVVPGLVFLGGAHSWPWVTRDISAYSALLAPGGTLCGHNYDHPDVRRAVNTLLPGARHCVDELWVWRKPAGKGAPC